MVAPSAGNIGIVYLLHFVPAYQHARHYMGWTSWDLNERIQYHLDGRGSPLVEAASKAGCDIQVAQTWDRVDRNFERRLKNQKNAPRLCPICREG